MVGVLLLIVDFLRRAIFGSWFASIVFRLNKIGSVSTTIMPYEFENLVVYNPGAGNAEAAGMLEALLDHRATHLEELNDNTDLNLLVKNAVNGGCKLIVAAGGDGTVNAIVNAIMRLTSQHRPRLAILPLGTANDFAGTLEIPIDVSIASALVARSHNYVPVDIIQVKSGTDVKYFANVAAGGNSVKVTEEMTPEMKEKWGAYCYLRGAVSVMGELESYRITAQLDQERIEDLHTWAVIVANGKTNAGRIPVAPHASPNDGLLDVILIQDGTVADLVEIVSGAIFGNYLECEQVIFRQCRSLTLRSTPGMRFTMDGEMVDYEPLQFEVQPGAIEMLVGPNFVLPALSDLAVPESESRPTQRL